MQIPSPCAREFAYLGVAMDCIGNSYHIKDTFFTEVGDTSLMKNKEDGHYRPHFFCFHDSLDPNILWAVPQSSKAAKYAGIMQAKISKYGRCDTIVIGNFGGRDNAFLIQNMFPILDCYIDHVHTIDGVAVPLHPKLQSKIVASATRTLHLHRRGYHVLFADVDRIYALMQAKQKELNIHERENAAVC